MPTNDDLSVAERCFAALKVLATSDTTLKSRLMSASTALLPIGPTAPAQYGNRFVEINEKLSKLEGMRTKQQRALAEEIFALAMEVQRDTFSA